MALDVMALPREVVALLWTTPTRVSYLLGLVVPSGQGFRFFAVDIDGLHCSPGCPCLHYQSLRPLFDGMETLAVAIERIFPELTMHSSACPIIRSKAALTNAVMMFAGAVPFMPTERIVRIKVLQAERHTGPRYSEGWISSLTQRACASSWISNGEPGRLRITLGARLTFWVPEAVACDTMMAAMTPAPPERKRPLDAPPSPPARKKPYSGSDTESEIEVSIVRRPRKRRIVSDSFSSSDSSGDEFERLVYGSAIPPSPPGHDGFLAPEHDVDPPSSPDVIDLDALDCDFNGPGSPPALETTLLADIPEPTPIAPEPMDFTEPPPALELADIHPPTPGVPEPMEFTESSPAFALAGIPEDPALPELETTLLADIPEPTPIDPEPMDFTEPPPALELTDIHPPTPGVPEDVIAPVQVQTETPEPPSTLELADITEPTLVPPEPVHVKTEPAEQQEPSFEPVDATEPIQFKTEEPPPALLEAVDVKTEPSFAPVDVTEPIQFKTETPEPEAPPLVYPPAPALEVPYPLLITGHQYGRTTGIRFRMLWSNGAEAYLTFAEVSSEYPQFLKDYDGVYEVEAIVKHRNHGSGRQYLVSWKGFPPSYNSWEPEATLKTNSVLHKYKASLWLA